MVAHDVNPILAYLDQVIYLARGGAVTGHPDEVITAETLTRCTARRSRCSTRPGGWSSSASPSPGRPPDQPGPGRGDADGRGRCEPHLSWNLVADVRQMFAYPFMVNAFRAGTIVAVVAGAVGWFMVLRRQTFAGHTLAVVGFPGAAARVLLGVSRRLRATSALRVAAALVIAALPPSARRGGPAGSARSPR